MTRHLVETAAVAAAAVLVSYGLSGLLTRRRGDEDARYYARRAVHFIVFVVALVAVGFVWRSTARAAT